MPGIVEALILAGGIWGIMMILYIIIDAATTKYRGR